MTMTLISTATVGSGGASSIDFASVPQTFTDLLLVFNARSDRTSAPIDTVRARFNGVTTGYSYKTVEGNGSSAATFGSSTFNAGICATDACTANTFGSSQVYISNYTGGTVKTGSSEGVSETSSSGANQFVSVSLSTSTSAITSLVIAPETGTIFKQYSTASLYGILKGSGGATVS